MTLNILPYSIRYILCHKPYIFGSNHFWTLNGNLVLDRGVVKQTMNVFDVRAMEIIFSFGGRWNAPPRWMEQSIDHLMKMFLPLALRNIHSCPIAVIFSPHPPLWVPSHSQHSLLRHRVPEFSLNWKKKIPNNQEVLILLCCSKWKAMRW